MGFFKKRIKQETTIPKGKVLSFLNQKGGVGKTTMSFNTAFSLKERGHKVLCIDMDPQANLSLLFGIEDAEKSVFNLLINSIKELSSLHSPMLPMDVILSKNGVDIIPAGQSLSGFELTVAGISSPRQLILKRFIENNKLLNLYDYIVIDGPPTLGLLVVNIMCASHGLLVPFRPDEFSHKGLGHFYDVLSQIEDMGVGECPQVVAHIPNLVDQRRKQEVADLEKIKSDLVADFGDDTVVEPFRNMAPLVKSQASKKSVYGFKGKEFNDLREKFNVIAHKIEQWNS